MATAGAFRFKEGNPPETPPSSEQYIYINAADNKLYRKDSNGNEVVIDSSGGGTTISAGTSFPASPTSGDYFFRTDIGRLLRYNGSAWDTLEVWIEETAVPAGAAGKAVIYMDQADHKLYARVHNGTPVELGGTSNGTSIDNGISFPGSPTSGDYFFRTDLGRLFRYNGAAWDAAEGLWLDETGTTPNGVAGKAVIYAGTDHKLYAKVHTNTVIPLGITITIQEQDDLPLINTLKGLKFPNGSLTDEGSGVVSVAFSAPLTVQEVDGTPSVSNVSTIRVSNGTLTDDTNGQVTIDTSGSGGGTSISADTSFPGSPTSGDYAFRTDLEGLYRYNGAVWQGVGAVNSGVKNLVINGSFAVWQRQDDPAVLTAYDDDTYCADRWYLLSSQANALQAQRIDGDTQRFALRLKQSSATATRPGLAQIIEGANCRHLRGKSVTLRLRVRCSVAGKLLKAGLLEWSGSEDDLTTTGSHDFVSVWGGTPTLVPNMAYPDGYSYSHITTVADTWQELVYTAPLGTGFNNLVVFLFGSSELEQNTTLDVEAVQVEVGELPTPFEVRSVALEETLCQRYFERIGPMETNTPFAFGMMFNATDFYGVTWFKAVKRVIPTITIGNPTTSLVWRAGISSSAVSSANTYRVSPWNVALWVVLASGGTPGHATMWTPGPTSTTFLDIDAEI